MRRRKWKFFVADMLDSIRRILEYTQGFTYESFAADQRTADAVIHNFVILGEAVSHIPPEVEARHMEVPWTLIRGMRNVVVHDYPSVRLDVIWDTLQRDLLPLIAPLEAILLSEKE